MAGNVHLQYGKSSDAAIQLPSQSFKSIWFSCCVFFCFLNSIADPEESYQSRYDFTVPSLAEDDSWLFETASKIFHQVHSLIHSIQIQKSWRSTKNDSNRVTLTSFPALLPHRRIHLAFCPKETVHIQTNRRRLLSKCNYLVLSISLTAVGQRVLCWRG